MMNIQFDPLDRLKYEAQIQRQETISPCVNSIDHDSHHPYSTPLTTSSPQETAANSTPQNELSSLRRGHAYLSQQIRRRWVYRSTICTPNLKWAAQVSACGLLLLTLLVGVIIWNDKRQMNGMTHERVNFGRDVNSSIPSHINSPASSSPFEPLRLEPMTSAFLIGIPNYKPLVVSKLIKPTVCTSTSWLTEQHERDQAEKVAHAIAPLNPIMQSFSSAATDRKLLASCDVAPESTFSDRWELFSLQELKNGAILLHLILLAYMILGWGVLWMNYVNPLARHLGLTFNLHTNKGEATLLAVAGCIPNFIMNMFAVFNTGRDFGTGSVLGSTIMNTVIIPIVIFFGLPHVGFPVYWWRASRDIVCFAAAVLIMVATTITGQQITLGESILLLCILGLYCYVLYRDGDIYVALSQALYAAKKKKLRDQRAGKQKSGLQIFVEHNLFNHFITLCIVTSIVFVIWDSITEATWLVNANYAISAIFLFEAALKLAVYGTLGYWSDASNAFDGVLVVLILFELIFGNGAVATSVRAVRLFRFLRALRGLRAVRAVRAARSTSFFKKKLTPEEEAAEAAELAAITAADETATEVAPIVIVSSPRENIKPILVQPGTARKESVPTASPNDDNPASPSQTGNSPRPTVAGGQSETEAKSNGPKDQTVKVNNLSSNSPNEAVAGSPAFVTPAIFVNGQEARAMKESAGQVVVLNPGSVAPAPIDTKPAGSTLQVVGSSGAHQRSPSSSRGRSIGDSSELLAMGAATGKFRGSSRNLLASAKGDGVASVRQFVVEKEEADGQIVEEVIVIKGNAGATAEELAVEADDDDDDDDDDDVEEEEDEDDHWEEILEEDLKGQVGEPVLDADGQPTGLVKVFVKGVEPRRWSALGPFWNPYRELLGYFMLFMMLGMTFLVIAVNIKVTIAG